MSVGDALPFDVNWERDDHRITLCVVGSGGVGKSCVTVRYLKDEFVEYYDPTIEESYFKEVECGTRTYDVEIIDTAGQDEFADHRNSALAQGDGFLVLFAINSPYSWQELKELRERIVREHEDKGELPMVIVGNKKDLDSHRQVPFDDIVDYCRSIQCPFIETSAKTGLNITEAFQLLIEQVKLVNPTILEEQWHYKIANQKMRNGHIPNRSSKECCIL